MIYIKSSRTYGSVGKTLLGEWKRLLGVNQDNIVDEEHLISSVTQVRKLAQENDLTERADTSIGQLFAFSPKDPKKTRLFHIKP